jgi:hypothetical protein
VQKTQVNEIKYNNPHKALLAVTPTEETSAIITFIIYVQSSYLALCLLLCPLGEKANNEVT